MRIAIAFLLAGTALTAQNPPASPQAPALPSDCAADGTVVNGLTGQPVRRANVIPGSANGTGTSTDAEGKWTISKITCGAVTFRAEKDGYIQNSYGRSPSKGNTPGNVPRPVMFTSGSAAHELKIELMPEAVITGRVMDDAGDPAAGAQIRVLRSAVQNGRRIAGSFGATTADSSGAYRLGGLSPGRYTVCATSNRVMYPVGGGSPAVYEESCFPGPVTGSSATGIEIEGGQEAHADFTLRQATGVHVRGTISGAAVTNPGGIRMFKTEANGMILSPNAVRPQQVKDGRFDFPNLPPGSYTLQSTIVVKGEALYATSFIDVGSTDVDGVSLVFQPGSAVSGSVQFETSQPEGSGKPVPNIDLNQIGLGSPMGRIQWDAEHKSFVLPDVQAGRYRINVSVPGTGYFVKSVRLHDRELRNQDFMIEGPTGPIEIVIGNESGSLLGTVADKDGNPAASEIILQCGETPVMVGRSRDDGTFTMRNIPAGACKAWAFYDADNIEYADEDWMRRNATGGADVAITTGSTVKLSLVQQVAPQ